MMTRKKLNNVLALLLAAVLTVGLLPIQASAATVNFSDVPANQWYTEYVTRLAGEGIVGGVGNGKFEPGRNVSSAEMIKMVTNAVFKSEFAAYEQANKQTMDTYFGSTPPWYGHMTYFAKNKGLLDGVGMDIGSPTSCNAPMTRYDMALVLHNAATKKGIAVSADAQAVAKAELMDIGHYYDIPEAYRDAVVACYAAGIINGKGEQGFCGSDNMTRAEACAVIIRLEDLLKNGGSTTDPDPTPSEPTEGILANGKPITTENVLEIFNDIQAQWPDGTTWGLDTRNPNGTSSYVSTMMLTYNLSAQTGCGGYAGMVSDLIFGKTGNPTRKLNDLSEVRPGDIIMKLNDDGTAYHVIVVIDTVKTGSRAGAIFYTDGNRSGKVGWPTNMTSAWNAYLPDQLGTCVAYTRYPNFSETSDVPTKPTEKDIVVTTKTYSLGTAWCVTDNGFATGYLNNGKAINEANVKELLEKAKTIWPTGMTWTTSGTANNNWYEYTGNTTVSIPGLGTHACNGFGHIINDYLFGKTSNPWRTVQFKDIRPGDIIISTTLNHAVIVIDKVETGDYAGSVFIAEGNYGKQVNWSDTTSNPKWNAWTSEQFGDFTAYTRWPSYDPGKMPTQPATPTEKDIVVTTTSATDSKGVTGTAYRITDNGFPTGYLGNGKPINDANIAELLEKAKTIWPDGMTWTSPGAAGNSWYSDLGSVAKSIPNLHGTGENYECSGFAVMLSDYLFGKNNNPWKEVTNFAEVHIGDIIIQYEANGTARHVMTVIGINQTGNRAGYVFCADGNRNNTVSWAKTTSAWNAWGPTELAAYGSYKTYTRWPS